MADRVGEGFLDGERLAIQGGSVGGYTTLFALTFQEAFKKGIPVAYITFEGEQHGSCVLFLSILCLRFNCISSLVFSALSWQLPSNPWLYRICSECVALLSAGIAWSSVETQSMLINRAGFRLMARHSGA